VRLIGLRTKKNKKMVWQPLLQMYLARIFDIDTFKGRGCSTIFFYIMSSYHVEDANHHVQRPVMLSEKFILLYTKCCYITSPPAAASTITVPHYITTLLRDLKTLKYTILCKTHLYFFLVNCKPTMTPGCFYI